MNSNDSNLDLIIIIGVIFILASIIISLIQFFNDFTREMRYLNSEIRRTSGAERKRWKKRRRRLWLSLIPFVKY